MASLEPPALDFDEEIVNGEDLHDKIFPKDVCKSLNNSAVVEVRRIHDVIKESNDENRYKPPSGFKQVDHASTITTLDFHVQASTDDKNNGDILVSVSDPKKMGGNVSAYITYKVSTKTSLPTFTKEEMQVYRRYSDFYTLYQKLLNKHSQEGRFVPHPPEKNILSMAKVKVTKDDSSSDFVEKRKKLLERFLKRIANHPHLKNDPNFVDFLEAESSPSQPASKSIFTGAGFLKLFHKVEDTFNRATYKMEECDSWFEKKEAQLNNMEESLQSLCYFLEGLIFNKKEFSQNLNATSKSFNDVCGSGEDMNVTRILSELSEVWGELSSCHTEHAEDSCYTLLEFVRECLGSILSAKETLTMRVKLHKTWKDSEVTLAKKREVKVRLELALKTDKLEDADREIAEWENNEERSHEDFERISRNIKEEMKRFDSQLVKDFKEALLCFLDSTFSLQKKIVKTWEEFLDKIQ